MKFKLHVLKHVKISYLLHKMLGIITDLFPKDLEDSRQVKILKKTTTLLNLQNMFRQKLLSSSVDRFTKR